MESKFGPPFKIEVEVDSVTYTGRYTLEGELVVAEWDGWPKKAARGANDMDTARHLVRELVREHRNK